MRKQHAGLMESLIEKHAPIAQLIGNQEFHYLDIPVHDNIGDTLIMQGTLEFFKKNNLRPKTISSCTSFKHQWVKSGDILVFHGGGNLGDLYQNINEIREKIIQNFTKNTVIILPQTIHFESEDNLKKSVSIFQNHPDIHLFVRDKVSLELAKKFTQNVYLVPDMAHQLYPLKPSTFVNRGNLRIQRLDIEKPEIPKSIQHLVFDKTTDWVEVVGQDKRLIDLFWRLEWRFNRYGWTFVSKHLSKLWMPIANRFTRKAVKLFSPYEHIVTDRLHGHILACLMSKPNTVIDNSYGKNSTYMNEWTIESDIVTLVMHSL